MGIGKPGTNYGGYGGSWLWKNTDCKPLDIEKYIVLCSNLSCIMFYSEVPNFNLFKNVKSISFR